MDKLKDYTLAGIAEKIECPFLVVHGENDGVVPVEYAHQLFRAVGTKQKTLKIFDAQEGGSDHCQEDNRQIGANYVADWLMDHQAVAMRNIVGAEGPSWIKRCNC